MAKTSFFKSCLGVFQGGGCRAAAFVGAYEEAINSGVSFAEVAGTSAGAIMAALIGAGASPSQLKQIIATMDFKAFLAAPERKESRGVLGKILATKFPKYADLAFDQGFHSSLPIKAWMEKQLADLLPEEKHPVTFRSLPFPTYVISTDLSRSEAKIWSQTTTPNDLVSEAVQGMQVSFELWLELKSNQSRKRSTPSTIRASSTRPPYEPSLANSTAKLTLRKLHSLPLHLRATATIYF